MAAPTDARARTLAAGWYQGPLYRFVSTGTIDGDVRWEVEQLQDMASCPAPDLVAEVVALQSYMDAHDDRGPQPGWADLWDDTVEGAARHRRTARQEVRRGD